MIKFAELKVENAELVFNNGSRKKCSPYTCMRVAER